jgi:hypothetical protein
MQKSSARTPPLGAAFSFVGAALVLAACASPGPFETNRVQAVKDFRTPEGKAYQQEFYPAIGADLRNLLEKCTAEFPAKDAASFEIVFRIDHWGEPKAILVNPVTDLSSCVASGAFYFTYPHPGEKFGEQGVALLVPIKID